MLGSERGTHTRPAPAFSPFPRNELTDHLDTIDSSLDNLQTMLTTHGFSVDTSALLDVSLPLWGSRGEGLGGIRVRLCVALPSLDSGCLSPVDSSLVLQ